MKAVRKDLSDDRMIISYGDSHLSVNKYAYLVVSLIETGSSDSEIKDALLSEYGVDEDLDSIKIIRNRLHALKQNGKKDKKYLFLNLRLFTFKDKNLFLGYLSLLYKKWIPYLVLSFCALVILVNLDIFHFDYKILLNEIKVNPIVSVLYFVMSVLILIVHEFGHASAIYAYGLVPKEISFGIYMYFPVFYTDVSGAWGLEKKKRLMVDCGGFYFQIILATLLILIYRLTGSGEVLIKVLLWDNILMILYNLNPLFHFDGYWLCSDFLDLPNLRPRSLTAVSDLIARLSSKSYRKKDRPFGVAYYLYGVVSILFILTTCCIFWRIMIGVVISDLHSKISPDLIGIIKFIFKYLLMVLIIIVSSWTIYSYLSNLIKNAIQLRKED